MRSQISARLQRAALIAVFALVSHALLPYLHALDGACGHAHQVCATEQHAGHTAPSDGGQAPEHSADCPVCSALAHGGARAIDAPVALPALTTTLWIASVPPTSVLVASSTDLDVARARAPPVSSLLA
jgi:hypothetical protein